VGGKLADHVTQAMELLLASDMAHNAARILNVFVSMQHVPNRFRLGSRGVPHIDHEDKRVAPGIIIENRFGRGVRQNTAVPIILAINADGRKSWRQGGGRHDVFHSKGHLASVEIVHVAGAYVRRTDREPRRTAIEEGKIDKVRERRLKGRSRIETGQLRPQRKMRSKKREGIWSEKAGDAASEGCPVRDRFEDPGPRSSCAESRFALYAMPEFVKPGKAILAAVSGYETGIDGTDRGADDPIGFDSRFMQRLIDAGLIVPLRFRCRKR
jgi:hypothetical protein